MNLRHEIRAAFSKVRYPGDETLTACTCEECRWAVHRLRDKKWHELSPEDTSPADGGAVILLTPAAFQYFLPGLMLLILDQPEEIGTLPRTLLDRLTVSDCAREGHQECAVNIRQLTPRQRRIVAAFLGHIEKIEPIAPVIIRSAISNLTSGSIRPFSQNAVEQWVKRWVKRSKRKKP